MGENNTVEINGEKIEITVKIDADELYKAIDHAVSSCIDRKMKTAELNRNVEIVNNITIDGSESPEDFAERLTRTIKMDMRTT